MVTRRESVWSNDRVRAGSKSQVFDERPQRDHEGHRGCESALQAARRAAEEVPRACARITRAWQLARWTDGSTHLWIGRRKQPGRGEGSSGLRFDVIEREA